MALDLPEVLLPEALCEPLALALLVVEASSLLPLLLPLLVALARLDAGAEVRVGWLLDCSSEAEADAESGARELATWFHKTGTADILSSWRAKMFLTSPRPCMLAKASGMAAVTEVMATRPASSCEGLIVVPKCPIHYRKSSRRVRKTAGGLRAE